MKFPVIGKIALCISPSLNILFVLGLLYKPRKIYKQCLLFDDNAVSKHCLPCQLFVSEHIRKMKLVLLK